MLGTYSFRMGSRRESTLVLQGNDSFWHAHSVGPRPWWEAEPLAKDPRLPQTGKERDCFAQALGMLDSGKHSRTWELVEVICTYARSPLGGVVLSCEAWRISSSSQATLFRKDLVLWALREHQQALDKMIDDVELRLHFRPTRLGHRYLEDGKWRRPVLEFELAEEPDPAAAEAMEDPVRRAVEACLGFAHLYVRGPPPKPSSRAKPLAS